MVPATIALLLIMGLSVNTVISTHKQHDLSLKKTVQQQSNTIKRLDKENTRLKNEKKSKAHFNLNGVRVENLGQDDK